MTRHQPLLLVLAGLAMTVAGWNLGGVRQEIDATVGSPPATRSSRPERAVRNRPGPSSEAAQRLAAIRATANPSERMRATIDLANSLSPTDFAAWLDGSWFTPRGGMESTVFTGILMERWRQEDPEGHLLWCRENDPGAAETFFMTWAEADPQRLLDFFGKHPDDGEELAWLGQIAGKHPELALRRFQEMAAAGISRDDFSQAEALIVELAKQSPAALEAIVHALPVSLKFNAEVVLICGRMQDSFATELRKLTERPDGLQLLVDIFSETNDLGGKLIDELPNLPAAWRERFASSIGTFIGRDGAAKWAEADLEGAGFTAEQAREIRMSAVSRLENFEPEAALKILVELDLPADRKVRMLESLFQNFRDEPEKAEALLALLSSEEERQIARKAFQPTSSEPVPEIKKIEQPAEWLAAATAPDSQNLSSMTRLLMLGKWDPEKLAALSAGFNALPDDKKRNLSELILETGLRDDFPLQGEVLAFLVAHPPERALFNNSATPDEGSGSSQAAELATDYAVQLGKENPEKAGDWIQALPDGDAKFYAAKNLQSVWSLYDPDAAERWLKSLPAATREKVEELK